MMKHMVLVIGILFLVLAAVAYGYTVTETDSYLGGAFTDENTVTPYRYISIPLGIGGLILVIVSAAMSREKIVSN